MDYVMLIDASIQVLLNTGMHFNKLKLWTGFIYLFVFFVFFLQRIGADSYKFYS